MTKAGRRIRGVVFSLALASAAHIAGAEQAVITQLDNLVGLGEIDRAKERPAVVSDVVTFRNFVRTQLQSKAEMTFDDGSLVRVGQNTLFSFNEDARVLSLKRGSALLYLTRGGAKLRTPSLTGAIIGTVAVGYCILAETGRPKSEGIGNVEGHVNVNGVDIPPGFMYRCDHLDGEKKFSMVPFRDDGVLYNWGSRKFAIQTKSGPNAMNVNVRGLTRDWDLFQIGVVDRRKQEGEAGASPTPEATPQATPGAAGPQPTPICTPPPLPPAPTPPPSTPPRTVPPPP